jgi:hypothetical protein
MVRDAVAGLLHLDWRMARGKTGAGAGNSFPQCRLSISQSWSKLTSE